MGFARILEQAKEYAVLQRIEEEWDALYENEDIDFSDVNDASLIKPIIDFFANDYQETDGGGILADVRNMVHFLKDLHPGIIETEGKDSILNDFNSANGPTRRELMRRTNQRNKKMQKQLKYILRQQSLNQLEVID